MRTAVVEDAESDPKTVAIVLCGSRSVGHERPDSDYDLHYVRLVAEKPPPRDNVEAALVTLEELRTLEPSWWTDAMVQGRVLVDKTNGELDLILTRLSAPDDATLAYDAYLNAYVRGKAALARGDELGGRLHAADSVRELARALFALAGKRPPFHDRLAGTLDDWEPRLVAVLRPGHRDAASVTPRRRGPDGVARDTHAPRLEARGTCLDSCSVRKVSRAPAAAKRRRAASSVARITTELPERSTSNHVAPSPGRRAWRSPRPRRSAGASSTVARRSCGGSRDSSGSRGSGRGRRGSPR